MNRPGRDELDGWSDHADAAPALQSRPALSARLELVPPRAGPVEDLTDQ
jgi:hypothetical protein